uniref:Tr-type G domain-containing protein n=1 Tax=Ditylenchus dipsaci TaxID=166011 RepID=A0A915E0L7_9BILA
MNAILGMFGGLAISSKSGIKIASTSLAFCPRAVSNSVCITNERAFTTTPVLAFHSEGRLMDIRRHKMLKHKRRKRWARDHFEYTKKQAQKKMKSEVLFRARMKEIVEDLDAYDAMAYINETIRKASREWKLVVAPSGRKIYPHWSSIMSLEELYGVEKSEYIDKRAGYPTPEDKVKLEAMKADYMKNADTDADEKRIIVYGLFSKTPNGPENKRRLLRVQNYWIWIYGRYQWALRGFSMGCFYIALARFIYLKPFAHLNPSNFHSHEKDTNLLLLNMTSAGTDYVLEKVFQEIPISQIRNVCIIAHVDHGKTTLADYLISSNGIISARLAGTLRYMDSREDEQTRGITMKASAISLFYDPLLVNLIDSPGHVDFGSEVGSAINLADIAVLVVDVVEGVCSQTESLLRQAISRKLDVILVVNKLDRMIVELKLNQAEAFQHIQRLIEHINSCMSQILQGQFLDEDRQKMETAENSLHFDPTKGNVLFASAFYGYAFSLDDFALLWSKKLGVDKAELEAEAKGKKSLFEQLVLDPLFELHKCALVEKDLERLKTLSTKLGLAQFRGRRVDEAFQEMMRQWMPLTNAIVKAFCRVKSAATAFTHDDRLLQVCSTQSNPLWQHIRNCDPADGDALVYAAKFFKLCGKKLALCRIMCGTVRKGSEMKILDAPKTKFGGFLANSVVVKGIYIIVGRELLPVETAPAGRICALESEDGCWFGGHVLCSRLISDRCGECLLKFESFQEAEPLVRVTIQPNLSGGDHLEELRACLKQLSVLDGAVRCLKDLGDLGQTNIIVSEPIVPFLETIVPDVSSQISLPRNLELQSTECNLRQYSVRVRMRAVPLPDDLIRLLQENDDILDKLRKGISSVIERKTAAVFFEELLALSKNLLPKTRATWWLKKNEDDIAAIFNNVWSFGPSRARANILLNCVPDYDRPSIWEASASDKQYRALDRAIIAGFDMAMAQGPLCDEAMQGVAIVLEEWSFCEPGEDPQVVADRQLDAQLHGQLISAIRQACRVALKKHPLRLVAAMYKCSVQTAAQALGKVQTVLAQRRAKVISENISEMSGLFEIVAYMPVVESFSFCEQLRKKSSGMASAQMQFSHWQLIEEDPYWQPTTDDEIEEYGSKGDSINQARLYMDAVRKRKGLATEEMIVVCAEKQRNLKRNK